MSGRTRRIGAAIVVAAVGIVAWRLVREATTTTDAIAPASASAPSVGTRGVARAARVRTETPVADAKVEAAPADDRPAPILARFRVTSDVDGAPIAGAQLELRGGATHADAVQLTTGADGAAQMAQARNWSELRVDVRARGFVRRRRRYTSENVAEEIVLRLEPGTDVAGRVVDDVSGDPIAGVALAASGSDEFSGAADHRGHGTSVTVGLALTDAAGRFLLEDLPVPASDTAVRVHAVGYLNAEFTCESRPAEPLVVRLEPAGRVRGVVRWSDGAPVAGAAVSASQQERVDGEAGSAGTLADDEGRYVVESLRLGVAYELRTHAQAYVPTAPVDVVTTTPAAREVVHDLVLRRPATLTVFVHAPDGTPAPWAQVAACRPGAPFRREIPVHAGAAGAVLDRVEPGAVTVHAWSDDWADTTADVALGDGETRTLTVTLRPLFAIEGVVVDDAGAPVDGATVSAHDRFGGGQGVTAKAASGADGEFRLLSRTDGERDVDVDAADHLGAYVNAAPGATCMRVVLPRLASVEFRIRSADGDGVRGLWSASLDEQGVETQLGGRLWNVVVADWTVQAPLSTRHLRLHADGYLDTVIAVQPILGKTTDLGTITLDRGAGVVVRVVACDDLALEDISAIVCGADGDAELARSGLGEDGAFYLHGLAPGPMNVRVSAKGYLDASVAAEARADPTPVTITLRHGCLLSVRVVDPDGLAALKARIDALAAEGAAAPGAFEMVRAGTYVQRVPFGKWRLVATRGDLRAEQTVEVAEGTTRDVTLRLGR